MIGGLPPRFLGFDFGLGQAALLSDDVPATRAYAMRFLKETMVSDLANLKVVEKADPSLFGGYQFWLVRT